MISKSERKEGGKVKEGKNARKRKRGERTGDQRRVNEREGKANRRLRRRKKV